MSYTYKQLNIYNTVVHYNYLKYSYKTSSKNIWFIISVDINMTSSEIESTTSFSRKLSIDKGNVNSTLYDQST